MKIFSGRRLLDSLLKQSTLMLFLKINQYFDTYLVVVEVFLQAS